MPSLQEVANQINDDLDQIKGSTALTAGRLDTLTQHLDADSSTLTQGLFAIWEVGKQCAALLEDNRIQNETIICWLQTESDLQCRILRKMNSLIEIETATRDAVVKLEKILEQVHAHETLQVDNLAVVQAQVMACCPPPEEQPERCYDPCLEGKLSAYKPKGQDWQVPQNPKIG
ncbi:hypothetical protein [Silvibacterium acidisoli]|uniref:hypothetical protein n=1 Tax=Acidobacteriaceae bacterium ZG23-2 TaxID=2883246 RepID=UPI00406CCE75